MSQELAQSQEVKGVDMEKALANTDSVLGYIEEVNTGIVTSERRRKIIELLCLIAKNLPEGFLLTPEQFEEIERGEMCRETRIRLKLHLTDFVLRNRKKS